MILDTTRNSLSSMTSLDAAVAALQEDIQAGRYSDGERLPSERELSEKMGVHRRVIRSAIAQLIQEGLVSRRPHCSPVVQARWKEAERSSSAFFGG